MSHLSFSRRWAGYLSAKAGLPAEKEVILAYVIEVLIINIVNVLLTLLLGLLLGVLPGTVACLVAVALFRSFAGGAHSSSPWRCGAVTVLVFPLMALLAALLSQLKQPYVDLLAALAVLTGLVLVILKAPVDSPSAPIISPLRRRKLKYLSILAIVFVAAAIIFLRQSAWVYAPEIQLCLIFSILWVSLILSKWGHRLMALIDGINLLVKYQ